MTDVDGGTGYPLAFEVRGGGGWGTFGQSVGHRTFAEPITAQPYLTGKHLELEEAHLYVDIMELADAILEDRAPRAGGEQARHIVEIIEKAQMSIQTGQAANTYDTILIKVESTSDVDSTLIPSTHEFNLIKHR